jgi:hypothetical protein
MMKSSLKKQPIPRQTQSSSLTSPKISIPPHIEADSGMSMGFRRLNWLHLKGQSISWTERIKTGLRSADCRIGGRPDERSNPSSTGRMRRNCLKVFRINFLGVNHDWTQRNC